MKNKSKVFILIILIVIGISITGYWFKQKHQMHLFTIEVGGKYGLIDKNGKVTLQPQFDNIDEFHEDMATVCNYIVEDDEPVGQNCGAVNTKGILKIPLVYTYSFNFHNGLAYVEKNQQSFLIDKNGKIIRANLPYSFEKIGWGPINFHDGKAIVHYSDLEKDGIINLKGEFIIKPKYDSIRNFEEGIAIFTKGKDPLTRSYGFIDINGNEIAPPKYIEASDFSDGMAYVMISRKNTKMETGYINKRGKVAFKKTYKDVGYTDYYDYSFHEGLVANPECKYLDKKGNVVFELKKLGLKPASSASYPNKCTDFNENLLKILYSKDNLVGFLDKKGKLVIKTNAKNVEDFSEGLVAVEKKGKWGFIDKTGKYLIKPTFDNPLINNSGDINSSKTTLSFKDGLAFVCKDKKCGYINKSGKFIWFHIKG